MRTLWTLMAAVVCLGACSGPAFAKTYKDPAWQLASLDAGGPVKSSQVSKYQRPLKRVAKLCRISRNRAADYVVTGWKLLKHRFTNYQVLTEFSHIDRATVKQIGCVQAFAATTTIMRGGAPAASVRPPYCARTARSCLPGPARLQVRGASSPGGARLSAWSTTTGCVTR